MEYWFIKKKENNKFREKEQIPIFLSQKKKRKKVFKYLSIFVVNSKDISKIRRRDRFFFISCCILEKTETKKKKKREKEKEKTNNIFIFILNKTERRKKRKLKSRT